MNKVKTRPAMKLSCSALLTHLAIACIERGWVPDALTRQGIRRMCRKRLELANACEHGFENTLRTGPIANVPEMANRQHYEVPAEFFAAVLGPELKYSCGFWNDEDTSLAVAEKNALEITCQNAEIKNGDRILELGCGWGSLTLWMARRFPRSPINAISNSHSQREFIQDRCEYLNIRNVSVETVDINDFDADPGRFDRIVSVEMFEHMHNYDELLQKISHWLTPAGKLLVHIFCHINKCYPFQTEGSENWMGRHFFTGGIMPSRNLLDQFDSCMEVEKQYEWNGKHYLRTANAWLENLDSQREKLLAVFEQTYGKGQATIWFNRWRMFFMACAELFGTSNGKEWFVTQALLKRVNASN